MPQVKKAELIEGIVYMPSPVRFDSHSVPDSFVQLWLGAYAAATPGTQVGANGTVKLDIENVPQPAAVLRIIEECGGASRLDEKGYLVGPPEMVVEIAASSSSLDLHDKLRAYRRNGVKEYLVWRTLDAEFDWCVLEDGDFRRQSPDPKGLCHGGTFPGLVLNVPALLAQDGAAALATLSAGFKSKLHQAINQALINKALVSVEYELVVNDIEEKYCDFKNTETCPKTSRSLNQRRNTPPARCHNSY